MQPTRDELYENITDCRARLLRGLIANQEFKDVIQEIEEVTKAALKQPNGSMMYSPLTEADGIHMDNYRLQNPLIDQMAGKAWTIAAAKINTLYTRAGFKFQVAEFFVQY